MWCVFVAGLNELAVNYKNAVINLDAPDARPDPKTAPASNPIGLGPFCIAFLIRIKETRPVTDTSMCLLLRCQKTNERNCKKSRFCLFSQM